LIQASDLFKKSRKLLKRMGDCSNVGIEPIQQTLLADSTEKVGGVLSAGVPGAGGVDAIFAIVLSPQSRKNVEIMWSTWGTNDLNNIPTSSSITSIFRVEAIAKTVVCPLLLKSGEAGSGVRIEKEILW
jgi:phosphomevalonate kinase